MMNDRVSVVIPCYNQAHLLPRALKSLERQDHPEIEVIVVDDGSPVPVVLPGESAPFDIKLIRINNRGLSGARNVGLQHATGDWIKFLDADDALFPECIDLQFASIGGRTDAISVIGFVEMDEETKKQIEIIPAFGDLREALLQVNIGPPHIYMFPKRALLEMGGFHEGERVYGGHEDYDLLMRMSAAGYHAVSVHKLGAVYYRHRGSMATFKERMDRTRAAVWATSMGAIIRSGGCSPRLLLAGLAGWVVLVDITPTHLAGPLEAAAQELTQLLEEFGLCLPKTEVALLRKRFRNVKRKGAQNILSALPSNPANDGPVFGSPQEVIDRRLGLMTLRH